MDKVLAPLFARLLEPGGRYLLSVALTHAERDAQPEPTYGGKGYVRWLTDEEYAALCALGELETALRREVRTTVQTQGDDQNGK